MKIGIPKELKSGETRVSLLPEAVESLVKLGYPVLVQKGAGLLSGFSDQAYRQAGARLLNSTQLIYERSDLVVKVKEPQVKEYAFFREGLKIFTFFHLAANARLKNQLLKNKVTALAYETLQNKKGETVLLKPMSQIAGHLSISLGARYLQSNEGGKGVLMSALPKLPGARVLVIGGGAVGRAAAESAGGLGARVRVLDLHPQKLKPWVGAHPGIKVFASTLTQLKKYLSQSDLIIGAVHVPGKKTPRLISRKMLSWMEKASVFIDVAVDQGGCAETTRPTTVAHPAYLCEGILHVAVPNLPALAGRTASQALSKVVLPYVKRFAGASMEKVLKDPVLSTAVNTWEGKDFSF